MAKWKRPAGQVATLELPAMNDRSQSKKEHTLSKKEQLLRRSLEFVKGEPDNEDAVFKVFDSAMDSGNDELAKEAIRCYSSDSNYYLCLSIGRIFELEHWPSLDQEFVQYCEKRLLAAEKCNPGMYMGDHQPELRSEALGNMGLYWLLRGDQEHAFELWERADDAYEIDEAIAEIAPKLVEKDKRLADGALEMLGLIRTKALGAKAMAEIADYL